MAEERKLPPIGTGSVDLAALHAADAKGHDLDKAIADATTPVSPLAEHASLDGLKKDDLIQVAETERVDLTEAKTVDEITAAILDNRTRMAVGYVPPEVDGEAEVIASPSAPAFPPASPPAPGSAD